MSLLKRMFRKGGGRKNTTGILTTTKTTLAQDGGVVVVLEDDPFEGSRNNDTTTTTVPDNDPDTTTTTIPCVLPPQRNVLNTTTKEQQQQQQYRKGGTTTTGLAKLLLLSRFRRYKSESSLRTVVDKKGNKKRIQLPQQHLPLQQQQQHQQHYHTMRSMSFSVRTQSTMSLSVASRGCPVIADATAGSGGGGGSSNSSHDEGECFSLQRLPVLRSTSNNNTTAAATAAATTTTTRGPPYYIHSNHLQGSIIPCCQEVVENTSEEYLTTPTTTNNEVGTHCTSGEQPVSNLHQLHNDKIKDDCVIDEDHIDEIWRVDDDLPVKLPSSLSTSNGSMATSTTTTTTITTSNNTPPCYFLEKNEYPELGYLQFPFQDIPSAHDYAVTLEKNNNHTNKSMLFVLHTELPGDEDVGTDVLSHPLLVEAIQTLCIPVLCMVQPGTLQTPLVRRTKSGRRCTASITILNARTLESLIEEEEETNEDDDDDDHQDKNALYGDNLTRKSVIHAIIKALQRLGNPVPNYLNVLYQGEVTNGVPSRTFVLGIPQDQPWQGEVEFATVPGVVAVKNAMVRENSVCVVTYDPCRVSYSALSRIALSQPGLCDSIYYQNNEERIAIQIEVSRLSLPGGTIVRLPLAVDCLESRRDNVNTNKQALRDTPMRYVPLTEMQSCLANRLIHFGRFNEAMHILSPFQGMILMDAMRYAVTKGTIVDVVDVPIALAWECICEGKTPLDGKQERHDERQQCASHD
jgi:hypothetical protein